jgi:hypothetical protein
VKGIFRQNKEYIVSGNNSKIAKWNWYISMDATLSESAKANGESEANDKRDLVVGIEGIPVDIDDGCATASAAVICATYLLGVRGAPCRAQTHWAEIISSQDHIRPTGENV